MATHPARIVLTYEDYLETPEDGRRYEIIDGELYMSAAPNIAHQIAVTRLTVILESHVRRGGLGRVLVAPTAVWLSDTNVVEPDLLFVCAERLDRLEERRVRHAPDLVVEVLSPSTARTDRHAKAQLYARFGVGHYWLVDPARREIVAYALEPGGAYREPARAAGEETLAAPPFADLAVPLAEVWD